MGQGAGPWPSLMLLESYPNLRFFLPLLVPISNHVGPNLSLSGTKSPNLCMYLSSCYRQLSVLYPSYPKTHISRFFWLPAIYGPGIHGYLSTRYLWVFFARPESNIWSMVGGIYSRPMTAEMAYTEAGTDSSSLENYNTNHLRLHGQQAQHKYEK